MTHRLIAALVLCVAVAGCEVLASDWPSRQDRTAEQVLLDLIQFQQRRHVRTSVGVLAHECFTDRDFAAFKAARTPERIVERLKEASDFAVVARLIRTLSPEELNAVVRNARRTARPAWREMGFIDRQGRGQTEAGHEAELMIARAIVDAFAPKFGNP